MITTYVELALCFDQSFWPQNVRGLSKRQYKKSGSTEVGDQRKTLSMGPLKENSHLTKPVYNMLNKFIHTVDKIIKRFYPYGHWNVESTAVLSTFIPNVRVSELCGCSLPHVASSFPYSFTISIPKFTSLPQSSLYVFDLNYNL